jgi:hypothetical protein
VYRMYWRRRSADSSSSKLGGRKSSDSTDQLYRTWRLTLKRLLPADWHATACAR